MAARGRSRRGAGRWVVGLVSLGVHAAAILLLLRSLAQEPYVEPPVMEVALVPPPVATRPRPERPRSEPRKERPRARAPSLPPVAPPTDVAPRYVEAQPGPGTLRPMIPGLRGCESLSRAARERCREQRWAKEDRPPPKLNLDLEGRFAENPEPFLSRRPKKGCRPRVTGDVDPMGDSGNAIGGVTCVVPF